IVRDASGEPTGVFKDNAMDLITRAIPPDTLDETIGKARAALKHAASLGVTTIQDMTAGAMELRTYNALRASRELTARIYSIQNHGIEGLVDAGIATGFGDDWIRIGGQKLFADGSMGSGTAAFFEPYTDDPSTSGLLIHTPEALEKAIFDADAAGFQVIVHAIGDRANAMVLDAFEKLERERGPRDRRARIEHAHVVRHSAMAQAIEYYTLGSAYAEFADDRKGSITAGKLADLVLLSKDLFSIPPREILETRPVLTIVGGRIVFEQPSQ